ncbi:MAG: zf-TFIIB domain-containing protein [Planctomycetota bacterium]
MRCPDHHEELTTEGEGNGLRHRCRQCLGFWLDGAVVEHALGRRPAADALVPRTDPTRRCPVDQTLLHGAEHREVDLDACPKCGGVWFDQGELERANAPSTFWVAAVAELPEVVIRILFEALG